MLVYIFIKFYIDIGELKRCSGILRIEKRDAMKGISGMEKTITCWADPLKGTFADLNLNFNRSGSHSFKICEHVRTHLQTNIPHTYTH